MSWSLFSSSPPQIKTEEGFTTSVANFGKLIDYLNKLKQPYYGSKALETSVRLLMINLKSFYEGKSTTNKNVRSVCIDMGKNRSMDKVPHSVQESIFNMCLQLSMEIKKKNRNTRRLIASMPTPPSGGNRRTRHTKNLKRRRTQKQKNANN